MRIYAEAWEIDVPPEYTPEFLRLDATNKDFDAILDDIKNMLHPDKKYELRKHFCRHDTNESCWVEKVG